MSLSHHPIEIVGGGLAGLFLGLLLARRGIVTRVTEAGHYPRHRVCGEFLSGTGMKLLSEAGLEPELIQRGARQASTVRFFYPRGGKVHSLPSPAWCLSRYQLDDLLAGAFRAAGGVLTSGTRLAGASWLPPGTVRATGRGFDPSADLPRDRRWIGLKMHALNVRMSAHLEMHFIPSGYVGLCEVEEGRVNICGVFRQDSAFPLSKNWIENLAHSTPALRACLADCQPVQESFCSVAGIDLKPRSAGQRPELSVGDAMSVVAPVTGNGMSSAVESASVMAPLLESFALGSLTWEETRSKATHLLDQYFAPRLNAGYRLHQWVAASPNWGRFFMPVCDRLGLWRRFFDTTR